LGGVEIGPVNGQSKILNLKKRTLVTKPNHSKEWDGKLRV
jgi:hypothetical protein